MASNMKHYTRDLEWEFDTNKFWNLKFHICKYKFPSPENLFRTSSRGKVFYLKSQEKKLFLFFVNFLYYVMLSFWRPTLGPLENGVALIYLKLTFYSSLPVLNSDKLKTTDQCSVLLKSLKVGNRFLWTSQLKRKPCRYMENISVG